MWKKSDKKDEIEAGQGGSDRDTQHSSSYLCEETSFFNEIDTFSYNKRNASAMRI